MKRSGYPPIADYALLGDCHSAALVARDGSIDWCAFHRFDASPVFARLLDRERGGHFRIAPTGTAKTHRQYRPGTLVLETRFETDTGTAVLTDCLPVREPEGRDEPVHPYHQLIRHVAVEEGEMELTVEFSPRFDYGLTIPRMEARADGSAFVYAGADALLVDSDLSLEQTELCGCHARAHLRAGQDAFVVVTHHLPHELREERLEPKEIRRRIESTERFWRDWSDRCEYEGAYRDALVRSALTLKSLTNAPTGAIVAAPTTSLPEWIGGTRNWDYRYAWLRDAALNLYALFTLGYTDEAHAFMGWLKRTTAGRAEDLKVVYGVGGERFLPERIVEGLEGYAGSAPVRVGNAANEQFQLDVYGELLDTAWLYHRHGGEIDEAFWQFLCGAVECVGNLWTEPDRGIWEMRGEPRQFVSSKVMLWVAVDRAIRLARALGLPADLDRWRALRAAIRERIERDGVDPSTGAFTGSFGARDTDASNLLIPLVRFLPATDPRVRATIDRVQADLTTGDLVYRYRDFDDGLPGDEGTFLICSFWLVDNLALAGEVERARALFESLLGRANDVGLLAEEIDPSSGEFLGNFPQAFSHVGLIGAAMNLRRAERRALV